MSKFSDIGHRPYICIWGNSYVIIENLKKVVFYDEEQMILQTEFYLKITGKNLRLKYLNNDNVRVDGIIKNIEFNASPVKGGTGNESL